jgi:ribosomal protein L37E
MKKKYYIIYFKLMNYKHKYLKYKKKYLKLKRISGGMDPEKKGTDEKCEMCFAKLNNETNQCSDSKAFKKVLSDGRIVCIACCEAIELMEDSKPSATVEEKPKEVAKTTVETTIKCAKCGNSYSPSLQNCNACNTPNPLFLRQPKKKKKKKKKK